MALRTGTRGGGWGRDTNRWRRERPRGREYSGMGRGAGAAYRWGSHAEVEMHGLMARVVGVAGVAGLVSVAAAQPNAPEHEHARARLVSEYESLSPGKTAWLGVVME